MTSLQLGTGTRKFFDYLLSLKLEEESEFAKKFNLRSNKELEVVMNEILE